MKNISLILACVILLFVPGEAAQYEWILAEPAETQAVYEWIMGEPAVWIDNTAGGGGPSIIYDYGITVGGGM